MPELNHDLAGGLVHAVCDFFPAIELLGAVEARHIRITLALLADGGGLSDLQAGRGALCVLLDHERCRRCVRRAVARQWRHHDAIGEVHVADFYWREKRGHGGSLLFLRNGEEIKNGYCVVRTPAAKRLR